MLGELKDPARDGDQGVEDRPGYREHPVGRVEGSASLFFVPGGNIGANDQPDDDSCSQNQRQPNGQRTVKEALLGRHVLLSVFFSILDEVLEAPGQSRDQMLIVVEMNASFLIGLHHAGVLVHVLAQQLDLVRFFCQSALLRVSGIFPQRAFIGPTLVVLLIADKRVFEG